MDIMKKTKKIEQYLQKRTIMGIAYSGFCRHCVLFLGYSCGVILSSLVVFLVFQMIIYSRSKQRDHQKRYCMDFMFEQSQVQNYLLQQLPVPYAA